MCRLVSQEGRRGAQATARRRPRGSQDAARGERKVSGDGNHERSHDGSINKPRRVFVLRITLLRVRRRQLFQASHGISIRARRSPLCKVCIAWSHAGHDASAVRHSLPNKERALALHVPCPRVRSIRYQRRAQSRRRDPRRVRRCRFGSSFRCCLQPRREWLDIDSSGVRARFATRRSCQGRAGVVFVMGGAGGTRRAALGSFPVRFETRDTLRTPNLRVRRFLNSGLNSGEGRPLLTRACVHAGGAPTNQVGGEERRVRVCLHARLPQRHVPLHRVGRQPEGGAGPPEQRQRRGRHPPLTLGPPQPRPRPSRSVLTGVAQSSIVTPLASTNPASCPNYPHAIVHGKGRQTMQGNAQEHYEDAQAASQETLEAPKLQLMLRVVRLLEHSTLPSNDKVWDSST